MAMAPTETRLDAHPEELLDRAVQGTLSEGDQRALNGHLSVCRTCAAHLTLAISVRGTSAPQPWEDLLNRRAIDRALHRVQWRGWPGVFAGPLRQRWALVTAALLMGLGGIAGATWLDARRAREDAGQAHAVASAPMTARSSRTTVAAAPEPTPARDPEAAPSVAPADWQRHAASHQAGRREPSAASLFEQASALRDQNRPEQAVAVFRRLQRLYPMERETRLSFALAGRLLLDSGHPAQAVAQFDQHLAQRGEAAEEALAGRATALGRMGLRAAESDSLADVARRISQDGLRPARQESTGRAGPLKPGRCSGRLPDCGRFGLLLAVLALARPVNADQTARNGMPRIEVIVAAAPSVSETILSVLRDSLARRGLGVDATVVPRIDPVQLVRPLPLSTPAAPLARVWLDLSSPRPTMYFVTEPSGLVYVRPLAVHPVPDAVELELIRFIVDGAVQAILEGQSLGVSPAEFTRSLAPPVAPPPARPPSPAAIAGRTPPKWVIAAAYSGARLSAGVVVHGPGLTTELLWPRLRLGVALLQRFPSTLRSLELSATSQEVTAVPRLFGRSLVRGRSGAAAPPTSPPRSESGRASTSRTWRRPGQARPQRSGSAIRWCSASPPSSSFSGVSSPASTRGSIWTCLRRDTRPFVGANRRRLDAPALAPFCHGAPWDGVLTPSPDLETLRRPIVSDAARTSNLSRPLPYRAASENDVPPLKSVEAMADFPFC